MAFGDRLLPWFPLCEHTYIYGNKICHNSLFETQENLIIFTVYTIGGLAVISTPQETAGKPRTQGILDILHF